MCHPYCANCDEPGTLHCSACNSGFYLELGGFSCMTSCPFGQYEDPIANLCQPCHYTCDGCTGSTADTCIKCAQNMLKSDNFCVASCPANQFEIDGVCTTCHDTCDACWGVESNECYSCNTNPVTGLGYYYLNNECIEACPTGMYPDNTNNTCLSCTENCEVCTSGNNCTQCVYGPF